MYSETRMGRLTMRLTLLGAAACLVILSGLPSWLKPSVPYAVNLPDGFKASDALPLLLLLQGRPAIPHLDAQLPASHPVVSTWITETVRRSGRLSSPARFRQHLQRTYDTSPP